ncbi:MAG: hypothetical protein AYL32_001660 [Candidatus Bathyarchaeota archaeon B26-2]|nr:MAG: hypothetical protein AYL32_001660 [Candidatus Bathyarchaeota archaeon B26-2]
MKVMLKTNVDRLVRISVMGEVSSPVFRASYRISSEGVPMVLPGVGGITYNVRVGDPATGWEADHVEPGVSVKNKDKPEMNRALNLLACVGNEAKVVSGDAKGSKGVVTGKHGGIEHVLIDFPTDVMEKMLIGDKVLIKAFGVGLKLLDFPEIKVMNMDPRLLEAIDPKPVGDKLEVPVTHIIPAAVMGSGLGADQTYSGDYDIQLFDENVRQRYNLDTLRLGDLVAIENTDHSYGRVYREGAITIGIVVHSDCVISGHGPGVTTLFTSREGKIKPRIDPDANIAKILKIRDDL